VRTQRLITTLPADLLEAFDAVCQRLGLRKNFVVEAALREKIEDLLDAENLREAVKQVTGFHAREEVRTEPSAWSGETVTACGRATIGSSIPRMTRSVWYGCIASATDATFIEVAEQIHGATAGTWFTLTPVSSGAPHSPANPQHAAAPQGTPA
jgi:hypothetical protein